jgi:excisionase family DNA binding protein
MISLHEIDRRTMSTDVLSTRQVATLLGVGEATVKRWADAGEIECFRTPGGHRKFRLRDVTAFVQKRQYETASPLPRALPQGADEVGEEAVRQFETCALHGDAPALVAQLATLRLRGHSLAELFDEVVAPAMHRIGEKWAQAKLSVAEEHIAAQAVIDSIARAQPLAEPPGEPVRPDRGTAIVAAVAGELHDIGARMAACLLRAQGFEVLAPLAQTPAREMADLILRSRASLVALSSTMNADVGEQVGMAAAAAQQTGGRVIVGGAAMRKARLPPDARVLAGMRELEAESRGAGRRRARA